MNTGKLVLIAGGAYLLSKQLAPQSPISAARRAPVRQQPNPVNSLLSALQQLLKGQQQQPKSGTSGGGSPSGGSSGTSGGTSKAQQQPPYTIGQQVPISSLDQTQVVDLGNGFYSFQGDIFDQAGNVINYAEPVTSDFSGSMIAPEPVSDFFDLGGGTTANGAGQVFDSSGSQIGVYNGNTGQVEYLDSGSDGISYNVDPSTSNNSMDFTFNDAAVLGTFDNASYSGDATDYSGV